MGHSLYCASPFSVAGRENSLIPIREFTLSLVLSPHISVLISCLKALADPPPQGTQGRGDFSRPDAI